MRGVNNSEKMLTRYAVDYIEAFGLVVVVKIWIRWFRRIERQVSTKLYDPEALLELQDEKIFKRVYRR